MYLTVKQQVRHLSKEDYLILRDLCRVAKNLTNQAIYNIRQHYFDEGKFLSYPDNYKELKTSENYRKLNANMAQQILKEVSCSFDSFFALLRKAKQGEYSLKECRLPGYLPKDSYATLVIGLVRINGNKLLLPYSNDYRKKHERLEFTIPPILVDKEIKEIRIVPKANARFFEIQYTYEAEVVQRNLNKATALALDLGIDNLITAVSSSGNSFIIDGKKLKSINQWYNKENAYFQRIKDKQHFGKSPTKRQLFLANKRNNRVNDYLSKAACYVVEYCVANDIGNLIVGYHPDFQKERNMGRVNNQNFLGIPYRRLLSKLSYLCELNGICFVQQEESYTSKASFWDKDVIPVYGEPNHSEYTFSGTRIYRGMYRTSDGTLLNADVNGALNILRKSNVVSLEALYTRGEVDTPVRIRIT